TTRPTAPARCTSSARTFLQDERRRAAHPRRMARQGVFLPPGGGRSYPMGRISSRFLADGAETEERYSISEWWLEPHTKGPGAHSHDEDDIFYVIEGTMSTLRGDRWVAAPPGSFVLLPGCMTHDFENGPRSARGSSTSLSPGASSRKCRTSCGGSRSIRPATPADGGGVTSASRRRRVMLATSRDASSAMCSSTPMSASKSVWRMSETSGSTCPGRPGEKERARRPTASGRTRR